MTPCHVGPGSVILRASQSPSRGVQRSRIQMLEPWGSILCRWSSRCYVFRLAHLCRALFHLMLAGHEQKVRRKGESV